MGSHPVSNALIALVLTVGPAGASTLPEELLRTVRGMQGGEVPDVSEFVPDVTAFGPEVVDDLLGLLRDRRVPALDGGPAQVLSIYQQELVLLSFEQFGRDEVAPAVERLLAEPVSADVSAAAILTLGAIGQSSDLRRLMTLALSEHEEQPAARVERALESALTAVLRRDPRGFEHLSALWPQVRLELIPTLIRAVGATSDGRGVGLLGQTLRWHSELVPLAVAQLRRLGPSPDTEVNADVASLLRPLLDPAAPDLCRAVSLTLGELEDFHAVPRLIQLLEEPRGVGDSALWALRKLSGCAWGPSAPWWQHWYETETRWFQNGRRQSQRRLSNARQGKVVEALREYAEHRLFRHELAADVEQVLYRTEPTIRVLACEALALLGSQRSLPALVEVARDEDPSVRAAARAALEAIAGEELGGEVGGQLAQVLSRH